MVNQFHISTDRVTAFYHGWGILQKRCISKVGSNCSHQAKGPQGAPIIGTHPPLVLSRIRDNAH